MRKPALSLLKLYYFKAQCEKCAVLLHKYGGINISTPNWRAWRFYDEASFLSGPYLPEMRFEIPVRLFRGESPEKRPKKRRIRTRSRSWLNVNKADKNIWALWLIVTERDKSPGNSNKICGEKSVNDRHFSFRARTASNQLIASYKFNENITTLLLQYLG